MQFSLSLRRAAKPFLLFVSPFITLIITELLQGSFLPSAPYIAVNYLLCALPCWLIYITFNSVKLTALIPYVFFLLCGVINHYIIIFRNAAFQPWDIFAAETALNVLPAMKFPIDFSIVLSLIWLILLIILCTQVKKEARKTSLSLIIATITSIAIIICSLFFSASENRDDFWDTISASRQKGFLFNFICNTRVLHNPDPENYDATALEAINTESIAHSPSDVKPNIIVIMNEAFADLSKYAELNTNRDPLEFFHGFNQGSKGELIVSVFGGGTCNTEYDFLTGNSSFMLRRGSYPMQQFVSKSSPSIASTLKSQGYQTTAIHPYYANGWNRSRAYPLLGFDEFISIEDFSSPEIMRQFVSDRCTYKKITEITDAADSPQFIFCVTMQNHLGYDIQYENFHEEISFNGDDVFPQTRQYLSLLKESDEALRDLIEYYKAEEIPTYILFFGDHQPAIDDGFYDKLKASDNFNRYTVPFLLWSNQEKIELDIKEISPNFLAPLLIKTAGLKITAYDNYLLNLMKTLPVISAQGTMDYADRKNPLTDENPYIEQLNFYHALQYNQVFDSSKRNNDLFFLK